MLNLALFPQSPGENVAAPPTSDFVGREKHFQGIYNQSRAAAEGLRLRAFLDGDAWLALSAQEKILLAASNDPTACPGRRVVAFDLARSGAAEQMMCDGTKYRARVLIKEPVELGELWDRIRLQAQQRLSTSAVYFFVLYPTAVFQAILGSVLEQVGSPLQPSVLVHVHFKRAHDGKVAVVAHLSEERAEESALVSR